MAVKRKGALAYALFIAITVTATLAAAGVLFDSTGHAAHAGGLSGAARVLPVVVDAAGVVVALLLLVQLASGFGLTELPYQAFRRRHLAVAWSLAGFGAAHGAGAVVHTLQAPEVLPIAMDLIGVAMVALVVTLLATGFAASRYRRRHARPLHVGISVALLALVLAHNIAGVTHVLTG